jgi:hypothetical protein
MARSAKANVRKRIRRIFSEIAIGRIWRAEDWKSVEANKP